MRRGLGLLLVCAVVVVAIMAGGNRMAGQKPQEPDKKPEADKPFPVVAYLPDYRLEGFDPQALDYVTDLIYFSLEPKPTGELDLSRGKPDVLSRLRDLKKLHGFRLLVALGGWERSRGFAPMSADPIARRRFVQALLRFCQDNQIDGVDFDWEHPANAAEADAYATLLAETKKAFQPLGLLVTATLASFQTLNKSGYEALDRLQIMSYDHDGRHATFDQSKADIEIFVKQGVPKSKICLGIPFYGRGITDRNKTVTYAEIITKYKPAPEVDEVGGLYFNGLRTVEKKTRYAREMGLSGVMFWEIAQDTQNDTSLLRAIDRIARTPLRPNNGAIKETP